MLQWVLQVNYNMLHGLLEVNWNLQERVMYVLLENRHNSMNIVICTHELLRYI